MRRYLRLTWTIVILALTASATGVQAQNVFPGAEWDYVPRSARAIQEVG